MNHKTNLFVCILIVLSINLQYSISAYAIEENDTAITEKKDLMPEAEIIQEEPADVTGSEIINGTDLSVHAFTQDDQTN